MAEQVCLDCLGGLGHWCKVGSTGYFKECETCKGTGKILLDERGQFFIGLGRRVVMWNHAFKKRKRDSYRILRIAFCRNVPRTLVSA
jgi:hypothetical protein